MTRATIRKPFRPPRGLRAASAGLLALILAGSSAAQCGTGGPILTSLGARIGELGALTLSGTPNATLLLAADLLPGNAPAPPYGTLCIALSPAFTILASGWLDPSGFAFLAAPLPLDPG